MKVILDNCVQCKEELYPGAPFCAKCGLSTSMADVYLKRLDRNAEINNTEIHNVAKELELEQQISEMKSKIDKLQQQQEKSEKYD